MKLRQHEEPTFPRRKALGDLFTFGVVALTGRSLFAQAPETLPTPPPEVPKKNTLTLPEPPVMAKPTLKREEKKDPPKSDAQLSDEDKKAIEKCCGLVRKEVELNDKFDLITNDLVDLMSDKAVLVTMLVQINGWNDQIDALFVEIFGEIDAEFTALGEKCKELIKNIDKNKGIVECQMKELWCLIGNINCRLARLPCLIAAAKRRAFRRGLFVGLIIGFIGGALVGGIGGGPAKMIASAAL